MLSKIYLCPADKKYGCTWEGPSDDIFEHFSQEHEDLLFFTGTINIILDVPSENCLLLVETEIYLLQTKVNEDHLNIYLRYLGPTKIASKLTYDIDLSANGMKIGKQNIKTEDGYFSVALECLQSCFGDVNTISCQLSVSGDFTSTGSNDSVFINEENNPDPSKMAINETDSLLQRQKSEDLTPNLQDLFSTPKEGNSPVEIRENKKLSLDETSRATWYAPENDLLKKPTTFLSRSQTFTSGDAKKNSAIIRHASMRSLSSIAETDLHSDFKCSNCESYLASPIFLCINKHNICATCYRDDDVCSICCQDITSNRNQELEEKSTNYLFTCTNKKNGCSKKLPHGEIEDHETNCTFCQYICPMEECGYKSGYKNMVSHLNLIHSSVKMCQSFIAIFQKYQELFLVNETLGIFYCHWTQLDNRIVWKAKFCGPKARKFFCELKFKGKDFKKPLLLTRHDDYYFREMMNAELKEQRVKAKNSILTITR